MSSISGYSTYTPQARLAMPAKPEAAAGGRAASAADPFEPTSNLSDGEAKQLAELKARDLDVKAHEAAHKASGAQYAGSASFSYQNGPDGRQYAIGGEVPIDAGVIAGDPDATIRKMEQVRAAALAPAEPSGQDRSVAALATAAIAKARAEAPAENAYAAGEPSGASGPLNGSLAQTLAEIGQGGDEPPGDTVSRSSDLSAYAAKAYRHQASPGTGVSA
ncbi:MAG: hypothetical protein ACI82N_000191 [Maricaulis sp.]|jgi:hypothetical protein